MSQELNTLASELFSLRQEVKTIQERHKAEIDPVTNRMKEVQDLFIATMQEQGFKSLKTNEANFSLASRKGLSIVNEAQARVWAVENNAYSIDKRLVAQVLKDVETYPDCFEPIETQSLTVKEVS